jgi:hypothetical protein
MTAYSFNNSIIIISIIGLVLLVLVSNNASWSFIKSRDGAICGRRKHRAA